MPLLPNASLPEEKVFPTITPNAYLADILDIESETRPSTFKNPDGSAQGDQTQYKVKFAIKSPGAFFDSWISAWVNPSLRSSTKSKRPTLPQLILAATGQSFTEADRAKVTGDFLNTLIGTQLRIVTQAEPNKMTGKVYAVITTFLPKE